MGAEHPQLDELTIRNKIEGKLKEWLKRFLPAEIVGTVASVAFALITFQLTKKPVLAAYAGSLAETICFYLTIILQNYLELVKKSKNSGNKLSGISFLQIVKNLVLDFGPAELLDSLVIRPFFLYLFPILLHNYPLGLLVGKIVSDIVFYIPVIISYELRMLHTKRQ